MYFYPLTTENKFTTMIIGVPKEIMHGEARVSATPETVAMMVRDGFKVLVERKAGEGSFYLDNEYEKSGAELVTDVLEIYKKSDVYGGGLSLLAW